MYLLDLILISIYIWNFLKWQITSLIKEENKFTLSHLQLKKPKISIIFTFEIFLPISIMGEEYGDMSCFKVPKWTNLCISLSVIVGLSSFQHENVFGKLEACQ